MPLQRSPMTLLFCSGIDNADLWREALHRRLPDVTLRVWPEVGDPDDIDMALVWQPPPGVFARLPNLRLVMSLGAGVETLLADPSLPDVPLVRMVADSLSDDMAGFVALQVLRWHRHSDEFDAAQAAGVWRWLPYRPAREVTIGLLGLGELGRAAAVVLGALGYRVLGWSRSPKRLDGVECFAGPDGLEAMLPRCDQLVCLLPLTADTRGILDRRLFARLPAGAVLVNAGRGDHLVEADLLDALDCGRLGGASLDVFSEEPLPAGHPFWRHPRIRVSPHSAAATHPAQAVEQVAATLAAFRDGRPLANRVERGRGY